MQHITTLEVGPVCTNCYILTCTPDTFIIVDPGDDADAILEKTAGLGSGRVTHILCTHGHFDHVLAAGALKEKTGAALCLHSGDLEMWNNLEAQTSLFGLPAPPPLPEPDIILDELDTITACGAEIAILHTPGHSPGSVSFHFTDEKKVFNGDTVFAMGVGRTDLWGGNAVQLKNSIQKALFSLDEDTILYPGHGPPVTVQAAHRNLAFL